MSPAPTNQPVDLPIRDGVVREVAAGSIGLRPAFSDAAAHQWLLGRWGDARPETRRLHVVAMYAWLPSRRGHRGRRPG